MSVFRGLMTLFLLSAGLRVVAADGGTLAERVAKANRELSALEAHYRSAATESERVAALQHILHCAAWLENVGGMESARADHLLALARLEDLGALAPLRYGFLADAAGAGVAELTARRPRQGELPPALQPFARDLYYLNVRNESAKPLGLGAPFVDFDDGFGKRKRVPARTGTALPEELRSFAALFEWPACVEPGRSAQALALAPQANGSVAALGFELRAEDGSGRPPRPAAVLFSEAARSAEMAQARRTAARIEREIQEERRRRGETATRAGHSEPEPRPKDPVPQEPMQRPLGVVERAGAGDRVQVRLEEQTEFEAEETFVVVKAGRVAGRVRVPPHTIHQRGKLVYLFQILEGRRETLAGGDLQRP